MRATSLHQVLVGAGCCLAVAAEFAIPKEPAESLRAFIDGTGPGWKTLGEEDFANVNCDPETWAWKDGGAHCTGQPVGGIRLRTAAGRRAPPRKAGDQLRARGPVAAPQARRQLGHLRLGHGRVVEGPEAGR